MSKLVPADWMPTASMRRVILHWTGGTNDASKLDREHYHIIIEGDGDLVRGIHTIADNESTSDGRYAAHALNCNARSIGVSLCGMLGAQQSPYFGGKFEITRKQWATAARVVAELCDRYDIPVTPQTVLQHGEIEKHLGIKQKQKWDVCCLPWEPKRSSESVGNEFRDLVRQELGRLNEDVKSPHVRISHGGKMYDGLLQDSQTMVAIRDMERDGVLKIGAIDGDSVHITAGGASADVPLYNLEGKGYAPVRKIANLLGSTIEFDAETRTVTF